MKVMIVALDHELEMYKELTLDEGKYEIPQTYSCVGNPHEALVFFQRDCLERAMQYANDFRDDWNAGRKELDNKKNDLYNISTLYRLSESKDIEINYANDEQSAVVVVNINRH